MTGTLLYKEEKAFQEETMALLVGKYYFKPVESSQEEGSTGRVTLVYRKNTEGKWLLLFDMDNMPPDTSPLDFK